MFNIVRESVPFGHETLILETGRLARQADGAVLVTYGETILLVTATAERKARPGVDFFPLGVHYQEKTSAAGRIPGGFIKRETRPSDKEVLTSRLIDRPLRPLFTKGYYNDTQVIATVLSYDQVNNPDIPAMVGASAALAISGLPFLGPIGGARVGLIDGQFVLNPTQEQQETSTMDLVVAGTSEAVTMVESEMAFLPEDQVLNAVMFGFEGFQPVIEAIKRLAAKCAKPPFDFTSPQLPEGLPDTLRATFLADMTAAYAIRPKMERQRALEGLRERIKKHCATDLAASGDPEGFKIALANQIRELEGSVMRGAIMTRGERIDGRPLTAVRPIDSEVGLLPRTHGSALFTRGETQALASITLGTGRDEQVVEGLDGEVRERFLLNYLFPPYSVGETGRIGPPGRREVGHGKLSIRSLKNILPDAEAFPYTIRVVVEITESNGSSSMATVCAGSLALMDAGVAVTAPVAGIAMGLIKEGDQFAILSDIMGDEDRLGDMDFKVAGTRDGVTALQMDIKITGVNREIMAVALAQAREGRIHILDEMAKCLSVPREALSDYAPRIFSMKIDPEKIREVIGPGGKVIRAITEETGCQIDIEDDGTIRIFSSDSVSSEQAREMIGRIVADVERGQIYTGTVSRVTDFGAFVNILPKKDGLVHISQLSNQRVAKVTDVVKEGDVVRVKVLDIDRQGRVKLTMRDV
jgi:polyribonucleotide nucleotidyltransferase